MDANRPKNHSRTISCAFAAACFAACAFADDLPWQGTELVFGPEHEGKTFAIAAPTNATAVTFNSYATVTGATLTLDAPAMVNGSGALIAPLAGTSGLQAGFRAYSDVFLQATNQVI